MKPIIQMQNIQRNYQLGDSTVPALRDIQLEVTQGEFMALKGPSGSGKSTLLNICGLLDQPSHGSLDLLGNDIHQLTTWSLTQLRREHIGFVFQNFNLVPVMSASENIEYPLILSGVSHSKRRQQVKQMLEQVGLEKHANHRPDHLSGGQRQRVAIARALIKQPDLVIADEPTANLDTTTASEMIELMHALGKSQGSTFLIATHDERMAARCDRVVNLVDGIIQ